MRSLRLVVLVLLLLGFAGAFDPIGWLSSKLKRKQPDVTPVSDDNAKKYLQDFGYVQPSALLGSSSGGGPFSEIRDTFKSAVRKFQEFAGLEPTGSLDIRTKKKMAEPRCGVLDVRALSSSRDDVFKWKKNRLTYSIFSYSTDLPKDQIRQALRKAFDTWSAATPLDFTEVSANDETADIKIKFAAGSHGDPWPVCSMAKAEF
ncbi:hypothetical protein M3Y95_00241300 [Aphelenchoides besseyi]|nr:hypothetical protein M3Y95_00241300 [Aphelenchoides besseyi]